MATYGGQFTLTNVEDLKRDIIDYINYYNQLRIKEKLGGLSPVQYRLSQAA
ncbi:TPA: IS3 family transposase [Escherichia coli]|nr:IS3 family transposase [Escherichia coli]HAW0205922.1 IS3 family transposase [Escherichia coli]HAW4238292.1 IS3 family transposase [Escherichia coli]HAW7245862.1 IS3 family transposase [Escherichia coli]HBB4977730.1 IS3 family transposase [Escherichia coli]